MRREERGEIVAAFLVDGSIEAAGALAARDRVPERDVMREQQMEALAVVSGRLGRSRQEQRHERPESVLRMCVVLLRRERLDARHRAEHQDAAAGVDARRETNAMCVHEDTSFLHEI